MSELKLARQVTLASWFGLFALTLSWVTMFAESPRIPVSLMLIVYVGPLLIPLRGLLNANIRAHIWTTLLVLFYFIHGIVEAWASPAERWLAVTEIIFSVTLFIGCFYFVRLSNRQSENS